MDHDELVGRIAELVATTSDGQVTAAQARAAAADREPLAALGFSSLAQLRLIDAVEREFRVTIDLSPEGLRALHDVETLATAISASAGRP